MPWILLAFFPSLGYLQAADRCAVAGSVREEGVRAIPQAIVSIVRTGLGEPLVLGSSITDARGVFCFRDRAEGSLRLRVTARTQPSSASPSCQQCCTATVEFPTWEQAIATGGPTNVEMRRMPAFCVRGEVRDSKGTLRSDVALSVGEGSWSATVFNEGGRFLLTNLPAGSYVLMVGTLRPGREPVKHTIRVIARIDNFVVMVP